MDHQEWLEQHDRMIADHDLRMEKFDIGMEKLLKGLAEGRAHQEKTDQTLRRAIRLSVLDARRQRQRNAEVADKMTQLASALTAFLERGGNGKH